MLRQNVRVAIRTLRHHPTFVASAVLSLAVAIGISTTVFSMLDAVLHPRIEGAHAERLYTLRFFGDRRHVLQRDAVYAAVREGFAGYEGATGYKTSTVPVSIARGDRVRDVRPIAVRSDFFRVVGAPAVDGRLGAAKAIDGVDALVITDRLRNELFPDNAAAAVGARVLFDGHSAIIVGIARRYVAFDGLDTDAWILRSGREEAAIPINLLRVRAGFDQSATGRGLAPVSEHLAVAAGELPSDDRLYIKPITRQGSLYGFGSALLAAAIAVLLIACANVANLQLARGLDRARELAVRASLGASRRDLIALLVTEASVLATAGLALGLVLSYWGSRLLAATVPESSGFYNIEARVTPRLLAAAGLAAVVCAILIGLLPAVRLSRVDLHSLMKAGGGTGQHRRNRLKYGLLLAVQVALALPMVSGAVLLLRQAWLLSRPLYRTTELVGYDADSVVTGRLAIAAPRGARVAVAPLAAMVLDRARAVPGIETAAISVTAQPESAAVMVADATGRQQQFPAPMWSYRIVSPAYFRALGLPVEKGTDFPDGGATAPSVIVNRATSTFLWPEGSAVGQLMKFGYSRSTQPWLRVAGVSGDHFSPEMRAMIANLDTLRLSQVYRVVSASDTVTADYKGVAVSFNARVTGNPRGVAIRLRDAFRSLDLAAPPQVLWMRDQTGLSDRITGAAFSASLFAAGALICLALAAFGVYGIVAQSVAQRRREIAVRLSLGATPLGILQLILAEGRVYVLAGLLAGLELTMRTIGWIGGQAPAENANAPMLALILVAVFTLTGIAACIPAVRATAVDPASALRSE